MRALNLDGHTITYDTGHKIPADVGMLVLLRRLSYPCTFLQLATEFGISTHQLCELSHATGGYPGAHFSQVSRIY